MTLTKNSEFLVLDHKNLPGGRLWSTDGACASGAIKSIRKVPKSYGGSITMVGSETECGPSSALQQLPRVASAASTRLSEYGAPSSYVKLGMCHQSPHPSTGKKKLSEHFLVGTIPRNIRYLRIIKFVLVYLCILVYVLFRFGTSWVWE